MELVSQKKLQARQSKKKTELKRVQTINPAQRPKTSVG